jgi:hypothetical protein
MNNIRKFRILSLFIFLTLIMACGGSNVVTPPNYQLAAPAGVSAKAGDSLIDISWQAMDGVRFRVHYGTASGIYSGEDAVEGISPITTAANSFRLTGLENGRTYYMAVTAFDPSGEKKESSFSAEVSAIPDIIDVAEPILNVTLPDNPLKISCTENQGIVPVNIYIGNMGGGTLSFTSSVNSTPSFLSMSPTSGSIAQNAQPMLVAVRANCNSSLSAGSYTGHIEIAASGASGSPFGFDIQLTVNEPGQDEPVLSVSSTDTIPFQFGDCFAGRDMFTKTITIRNSGGGSFTFNAAATSSLAGWLSISQTTGTLGAGSSIPANVVVDCRNITTENVTNLSGQITITAAGATGSPYTLGVSAALRKPATIVSNMSPTIQIDCTAGQATVSDRSFAIVNQGQVGFTYNVSFSPVYTWLTADPTSKHLAAGEFLWQDIKTTCATLAKGVYTSRITVAAPQGDDGKPVDYDPRGTYSGTITVNVTDAPTPPRIALPSSLDMICYKDVKTVQGNISVGNSGTQPLVWNVAAPASPNDHATWLSHTPIDNASQTGPGNIAAVGNCENLTGGVTESTKLTVASNDTTAPTKEVAINMAVIDRSPAKPILGTIDIGYTELRVNWQAVTGATHYDVCYSLVTHSSDGLYDHCVPANAPDISTKLTGLVNRTIYHIAVRAHNQFTLGAFSDEKDANPSSSLLTDVIRPVTQADGSIYANCVMNGDTCTWTENLTTATEQYIQVGGSPLARSFIRFSLGGASTYRSRIVQAQFRVYFYDDNNPASYPSISLNSIADFGTLDFSDWNLTKTLVDTIVMNSNVGWKQSKLFTDSELASLIPISATTASFELTGGSISPVVWYRFHSVENTNDPELILSYKSYTW